jgi:DNA-binding GntR family transcriptional regulator
MTPVGKPTRTEQVYRAIRADLINGRTSPGERLRLVALSEQHGVSMTVLREALARLSEQGLVLASPQRGFSVAPLSIADLRDLTTTRCELETVALRRSIELGGIEWETAIAGGLHRLERTSPAAADGSINEDWVEAHQEFHRALVTGSQSPRLEMIVAGLRDASELYRMWSRSLAGDDQRDLVREHRTIAEAALAHDTDAASSLLVRHFRRTEEALLAFAEQWETAQENA